MKTMPDLLQGQRNHFHVYSHGIAILFFEQTNTILLTAFTHEIIWILEIMVLHGKLFCVCVCDVLRKTILSYCKDSQQLPCTCKRDYVFQIGTEELGMVR